MKRMMTFFLLFNNFWLLAQAPISFQKDTNIVTGSSAHVIEIADLNNDGLSDVIVGNTFYFDPSNDYKLKLFLQNKEGTLDQPLVYPYTDSTEGIGAICIGDINQDGLEDVIVGAGDRLKIFYQKKDGGLHPFKHHYSGVRINGVGVGDLNNDGFPDIVVSHWNEDFIKIFLQNQTGFTTVKYTKPEAGFDELQVADINHDGLDDVLFMAGQRDGGISIYLQKKDSTLKDPISYYPKETDWNSFWGFDIGDLTGDGKVDMVASMGGNYPTSKMVLWTEQDSTIDMIAQKPESISAFNSPEPVKIDDLNCDGKNEIICILGGGILSIFESDSSYEFSTYTNYNLPYATHYTPYGVATGDLNNDSLIDVAVADYNHGLVLIYNNTIGVDEHYTSKFTTVKYDTTFIEYQDSSLWVVKDSSWFSKGFSYFKKDSIQITYRFQKDSINRYEEVKREGEFCGKIIKDSSLTQKSYVRRFLIQKNNLVHSELLDSLDTSKPLDSANTFGVIVIYPNPNSGQFAIDLPNPYDQEQLGINVFNSIGQIVYHEDLKIPSNRHEVNIVGLAKGNYTIRLMHQEKSIAAEKLVIF